MVESERRPEPYGSAGFQISQEAGKNGFDDAARGRTRSPVFFTITLALLHRLFQFLLVISMQSMVARRPCTHDTVTSLSNAMPAWSGRAKAVSSYPIRQYLSAI
jgi:hypothetical protein